MKTILILVQLLQSYIHQDQSLAHGSVGPFSNLQMAQGTCYHAFGHEFREFVATDLSCTGYNLYSMSYHHKVGNRLENRLQKPEEPVWEQAPIL